MKVYPSGKARYLPLGIFDSGIGGLTVVREIKRILPAEGFIYLGDTARVPYGTKSAGVVRHFSEEIAQFLVRQKIKLLVIACNTASAYAGGILRRQLTLPVVDVIQPGVKRALAITRRGRIGIIGTPGTINSGVYQQALKRANPGLQIFVQACPLFVPLVEEGWLNDPVTRLVSDRYLSPLRKKRVDTLVLGCTHYPLLKRVIQQSIGRGVQLVDSAEETASEIKQILKERGLLNRRKNPGQRYLVTDVPEKFAKIGRYFLHSPSLPVERVDLSRINQETKKKLP